MLFSCPVLSYAGNKFAVDGKPINPACLAMIDGSLADRSFLYEINISRCQNSNAAFDGSDKGTSFKYQGGVYGYKVVGQTKNHIFVVTTTASSDGAGIFQTVLLLKLQHKYYYDYSNKSNQPIREPYLALIYLGDIGGGDRATGSYHGLYVKGNWLKGWRYSTNNPANVPENPDTKVNINLSKLSK